MSKKRKFSSIDIQDNIITNENISIDNKIKELNVASPNVLLALIKKQYLNMNNLNNLNMNLDELRENDKLKKSVKNVLKKFPFVLFAQNIITEINIKKIKKFMKTSQFSSFKSYGDKRDTFFSESYHARFAIKDTTISSIYAKGENSPTKEIDDIIKTLCHKFYLTLKEHNVDFTDHDKQINVFLARGGKDNDKKHVRWHRDEDGQNIPSYSMVVLLDKPTWDGGDFLCQWIGKNANAYKKKAFTSPIINITPKYKGGIILRNYDTRHMVEAITTKSKKIVERTVLVLQIYDNLYAYDQDK